jgi:hypothetical protein
MAISAQPTSIVPVLFIALVAWRVLRRIRKNIGRQPLQPRRMIIRIVIFSVLIALMGILALRSTRTELGLGGGVLLGVVVGLVGLYLTRFEATADGHFYTPNTYIGVILSLLLVGRLAYRMGLLYSASQTAGPPSVDVFQSPLTLFLFGVLAGYYVAYYLGVFVRCRQLPRAVAGNVPQ